MAISKFSRSTSTRNSGVEYSSFSADNFPAGPALPSVTKGLIGHYTAATWDNFRKIWRDNSGNNNHAEGGSNDVGNNGINDISVATNSAAFGSTQTFQVLQGSAGSRILFPRNILPSVYTLFYVARYNTSNSSTAATSIYSNVGSSSSFFGVPFGTDSISIVNNEVRVSYSGSVPDEIWTGINWNNMTTHSAGNTYMASIDCRTSAGAYSQNDSRFSVYGWDSQQNISLLSASSPIVSAERRNSSAIYQLNSGFSFGSLWMRGRYGASTIFGSGTESFYSNIEYWRINQSFCNKIFAGFDKAWYSGFYAGHAGSIQHGNVKYTSNNKSNNWVLGTDTPNLFRVGKTQLWSGTSTAADTPPSARLCINPTLPDGSNFQVAEVIVYDRILSSSEITSIENELSTRYGI